jgi:hypothetical protein
LPNIISPTAAPSAACVIESTAGRCRNLAIRESENQGAASNTGTRCVFNPNSEVAGVIRWNFNRGLNGFYGFQNAPNRFGNRFLNLFIIRVDPVRQAKTGFSIDLKCDQHVK